MKDTEKTKYQTLFNNTLRRISTILSLNQVAQKQVRKALYDFSDNLKEQDLIKDKEHKKDGEFKK